MTRIILIACVLLSSACRRAPDRDPAVDENGCRYPERYLTQEAPGPDPEKLAEYEACARFAFFQKTCLERGYRMVGSSCRRVRDGKVEYTGRSPYLGLYDFSDGAWEDCKPHARPYMEQGDPLECLGVEEGDDPAKVHWACVQQPSAWCPEAP